MDDHSTELDKATVEAIIARLTEEVDAAPGWVDGSVQGVFAEAVRIVQDEFLPAAKALPA